MGGVLLASTGNCGDNSIPAGTERGSDWMECDGEEMSEEEIRELNERLREIMQGTMPFVLRFQESCMSLARAIREGLENNKELATSMKRWAKKERNGRRYQRMMERGKIRSK